MPVIVSLLRAVNLGGRNRIRMEELRALYVELGFRAVRTYVQSGNVVCHSSGARLPDLRRKIEDGIGRSFGFRPAVILRTLPEMRDVVAANPFAGREGIDPSKLLVLFLEAAPAAELQRAFNAASSEDSYLIGAELYTYFPDGVSQARPQRPPVEKVLGVAGTARNWNTVTKLLALAEAAQSWRAVLT